VALKFLGLFVFVILQFVAYLLRFLRSDLFLITVTAVFTTDQLELFMQGKEKAILEEIEDAGQSVLFYYLKSI